MSRLVRHDAKGPAVIELADGKIIEICLCGLSKDLPFCDSSHRKTRDEPEHTLFVYDAEQNRVALPGSYPPATKKFVPP